MIVIHRFLPCQRVWQNVDHTMIYLWCDFVFCFVFEPLKHGFKCSRSSFAVSSFIAWGVSSLPIVDAEMAKCGTSRAQNSSGRARATGSAASERSFENVVGVNSHPIATRYLEEFSMLFRLSHSTGRPNGLRPHCGTPRDQHIHQTRTILENVCLKDLG